MNPTENARCGRRPLGPGASFQPLVHVGSRRWFLQVGFGGLAASMATSTASPWTKSGAAEEAMPQRTAQRATSVIQIWLSGGPSQIDMWDPKPSMPPEIRGPYRAIRTAVPGIEICEHLPRQAAIMDKLVLIRSMDASASDHTPITFQACHPKAQRVNIGRQGGGYPSMGSVAARYRGANQPGMPAFVALADDMVSDIYGAGDLGQAYEPLDGVRAGGRFSLPTGMNVARLQDRDRMRQELDRLRTWTDRSEEFQKQDRYTQEAYELVLSGRAQAAFDVSREPAEVRDRYGRDSLGEKALLARRLVEAGVTYVTLSDAWGHWDHHGDEVRWGGIEKGLTPMLPGFDRGVTALIEDLDQRGLLETTLVIIAGEFGRSPMMTKTGGRDHWPPVMSLLLAGGGLRGGQVVGATDRQGGAIQDRPLGPGDLAATVFHCLGISPGQHWMNPAGRPVALVESGRPIQELL